MFLESAPTGRVSTQGWELWKSTQCNSELLSHLLGAVPEEFHPRLPSAHAGWLSAPNHLEQEMPPQFVSMAKNSAGWTPGGKEKGKKTEPVPGAEVG